MKTLSYNLYNEIFEAIELKITIKEVLSTLTPREEKILKLRFGLDGNRTHTQKEVGEIFGVSAPRIATLESRALHKLRLPSRWRKLQNYKE